MQSEAQLETCSLWKAFDDMQLCYTIAPQVKHYYRFGTLKDCKDLTDEFKFCWQTKRKSAIEAHVCIN